MGTLSKERPLALEYVDPYFKIIVGACILMSVVPIYHSIGLYRRPISMGRPSHFRKSPPTLLSADVKLIHMYRRAPKLLDYSRHKPRNSFKLPFVARNTVLYKNI